MYVWMYSLQYYTCKNILWKNPKLRQSWTNEIHVISTCCIFKWIILLKRMILGRKKGQQRVDSSQNYVENYYYSDIISKTRRKYNKVLILLKYW